MATRIKSNQIEDNTIVAADLHSAIAINTTASGTFGSVTSSGTIAGSNTISTSSSNGFVINNIGRMKMDSNNLYLET